MMKNKIVPVWEMIKLLMESPKRTANRKSGLLEITVKYEPNKGIINIKSGNLVTLTSDERFEVNEPGSGNLLSEWEIIEPEPEPVDFMTAIKNMFRNNKVIQSLVTDKKYGYYFNYCSEITDEEIEGKWILLEAKI